jgi:MFS family permease
MRCLGSVYDGVDPLAETPRTPSSVNPIVATWPLLLGMGILMLGAGLQSTLLGVRATSEGFPTLVTGIVMSCYYVGYLVGTRLAPQLLRRVGPVRVFATLAALASVAVLVHGAWVQPVPWALMRLLSGICFAGIYVVAESWLNHRASSTNRGQLLAIYMLVLYVGLGGAQFLLVLSSPQTTEPFMLVSALISAAMVPIVASAQEVARPPVPQRVRFRDLYRNSPLGVVAVAVSGMISSIIFSMGPVYARLSGFGTRGVAEFMGVSILAAVLTQYPIGRLSDRIDRRTVIASMCLLATLVAAAIEVSGPLPRLAFLALAALFSGAALTLYSLSVSHVNDKLDPSQMVAASSALLLINGTAAAFGPVIAGGLMTAFTARAYFAILGTLTAALTLFDMWRKLQRRPVPQSQKGPFINTRDLITSVGLDPAPMAGVEPLELPPAPAVPKVGRSASAGSASTLE